MSKQQEVETPTLQIVQKQNLMANEIIGWINGRYVNEILLAIAKKLKDGPAVETIADELKKSGEIVEVFKKEYFAQGGKDRSFEVQDGQKLRLLEQEILSRSQAEYLLQHRGQAAEKVGNKEMSARTAEELAKVIGYLEGLRKEYKTIRKRVEKDANTALSYQQTKPN